MIYSTIKDLFKGICDAIRSKDGTAEAIDHQDIPSRIQAIQSGLDTSDATATAGVILKGKTAYAKGSKVTGTLEYIPNGSNTAEGIKDAELGTSQIDGVRNLKMSKTITTPVALLENTVLSTYTPIKNLGDASAADVAEGKTFTSAAGLKVTGTHKCETPSGTIEITANGTHDVASYASANVNVPSGGIDTSDADATAGDIAHGKTAYVNGEKITGSIASLVNARGEAGVSKSSDGNNGIKITYTGKDRRYIDNGAYLFVNGSDIGDATAADVAAGKTFTSAAGLKVTGTHECAAGLDTSDATATAGDILSGKTAYVNGSKVTGSIAAKSELDITASGKTVTVPAGYYASSADKSVETATQATPTISVDNSGKITATSEQSAGYVAAGTKSATKQLSTQAAQTITPGTEDKTIASGKYLTGNQIIKGDPNLLASNIKSGVSIFGVSGSYSGSSGGGSLTSKSGTITTSSFDTGFSEIVAIIIDKASENSTGMTMASFIPILGKGTISGCSSYNTYMKQYASKISSNSCNVEGGTFNWVDTNATYAFKEGDSYYWYAIGYE